MTVKELIERLEELDPNATVVVDGSEVEEVVLRDEMFYTAEGLYSEGYIVKLY